MDIRRVITGEVRGKSVFTAIETVAPISARNRYFPIIGWEAPVTLPIEDGPSPYTMQRMFPDAGGIEVFVLEIPSDSAPTPDVPRDVQERVDRMRETGSRIERLDDRGTHRTDSVDIAFVLDGEITVIQDDDVEVTLRRGDCLVQNGAAHRWANRSDAACNIAFVMVGADRETG